MTQYTIMIPDEIVVAPAVPVEAPLGEPPGTTPFTPLVYQQKQGRLKATTTLDNGVIYFTRKSFDKTAYSRYNEDEKRVLSVNGQPRNL